MRNRYHSHENNRIAAITRARIYQAINNNIKSENSLSLLGAPISVVNFG